MPREFVLTLSGPDRIGIVEEVTGLLLDRGGNVLTSRMSRLGGEFAILLLATLPEGRDAKLDDAFHPLTERGYKITLNPAVRATGEPYLGWRAYRIEVQGADHEGIIHEVAHYLAGHGISIESVESETTPAPVSGSPLFTMTALVLVPPDRDGRLVVTLEDAGIARAANTFVKLHDIRGVMSVAMIYQYSDESETDEASP